MRLVLAVMMCCLAAAPTMSRADDSNERQARNTIYVELGGNGAVYSLNYERFLDDNFSLRLGASYMGLSASAGDLGSNVSIFTIPVTASFLGIHSGGHALELGAGAVYASVSGGASDSFGASAFGASGVVGTAIVGYRYAPPNGGFNFRAAFTPLFAGNGSGGAFVPWFGLAFGAGF